MNLLYLLSGIVSAFEFPNWMLIDDGAPIVKKNFCSIPMGLKDTDQTFHVTTVNSQKRWHLLQKQNNFFQDRKTKI